MDKRCRLHWSCRSTGCRRSPPAAVSLSLQWDGIVLNTDGDDDGDDISNSPSQRIHSFSRTSRTWNSAVVSLWTNLRQLCRQIFVNSGESFVTSLCPLFFHSQPFCFPSGQFFIKFAGFFLCGQISVNPADKSLLFFEKLWSLCCVFFLRPAFLFSTCHSTVC